VAKWTEDEIVLALEYYYGCPENMHTDSHASCQKRAGVLGRSPGALDKILRNIKQAETGGAGLEHASSLIRQLVSEYAGNPKQLKEDAAAIRGKRGLPPLSC